MSDADLAHSPCWLNAAQLQALPSALQHDWLFDQGSLTRRLTALAAGEFTVEPLQQGWQTLRGDECEALGVPAGTEGWVREVYLQGGGQPRLQRAFAEHAGDLRILGPGLDPAPGLADAEAPLVASPRVWSSSSKACRFASESMNGFMRASPRES